MIRESLVPKLALDKSEQGILDDTLGKTVSEVVETLLADHENRQYQNDDDARTNTDDILRSYTDFPRAWCTLSDLEADSIHASVTPGGATSTSTATSAEEESPPKSFDYGTSKDGDAFPTFSPKPPTEYGDLHLSNLRTLTAAE